MTTSTALRPSVRAAFGALIDYAGLFPPAELPLDQAAREYVTERRGPYAWMLGRFIVPATLLAQAGGALTAPLSIIVDPNVDALQGAAHARERGANVGALEIPLAKSVSPLRESLSRDEILDVVGALEADITLAGLRDLACFVEIPRAQPWDRILTETLDVLARFRLGAKVRCGGVTRDAFPTVEELAAFIAGTADAGLPFKATAGLHHPVRHLDAASGFTMHGFLNVLAAAALAARVDFEMLSRVIAEEDPDAFRFDDEAFYWRDLSVTLDELVQTRVDAFVSYGSCSFTEPVEDLTALRILPIQ